jgi:GTPase SAR1 family protein
MNYIDLFIQKDKDPTNFESKHILSEIIQNHLVSIVLGSPGSGKTSILKKYAQDFPTETQFVTVNSFLNERFNVNENIKYLLLDGLDEFKSISPNKLSVIEDIGYKVKELEYVKTVITCRQADWFGNSDTEALNNILTKNVEVYNLSKLDNSKKVELANLFGIKNSLEFWGGVTIPDECSDNIEVIIIDLT